MRITDILSRKIAAFSLVCAMLIVVLHVHAQFEVGSFAYFVYAFIRGCSSIAVPFFCVASGFFLAGHMGESGWWRTAVGKRVRTLVVPFFIWSALAWAFYVVLHYFAAVFGMSFANAYVCDLSWQKVLTWFGFNPFDYMLHGYYWYVRMLFCFVLISPLFLICRRRKTGALIVFTILAILLVFNRLKGDGPWTFFWDWSFPIRCVLFLSVGIWLRWNPVHVSRPLGVVSLAFAIVILCLQGLGVAVAPELGVLKTIALLLGLWTCVNWRMSMISSSCSFPVYTLHWFVVRIVQVILMAVGVYDATQKSFLPWLLMLVVVEIGSLGAAFLMRRFLPKTSVLMFGR